MVQKKDKKKDSYDPAKWCLSSNCQKKKQRPARVGEKGRWKVSIGGRAPLQLSAKFGKRDGTPAGEKGKIRTTAEIEPRRRHHTGLQGEIKKKKLFGDHEKVNKNPALFKGTHSILACLASPTKVDRSRSKPGGDCAGAGPEGSQQKTTEKVNTSQKI